MNSYLYMYIFIFMHVYGYMYECIYEAILAHQLDNFEMITQAGIYTCMHAHNEIYVSK
jgi:hypothetical protein